MLFRSMNGRKTKLGSDHPDTLTSMANLALIYWNQGRLEEAHSLLSRAVQAMQMVMGTSHPTVLLYIEHLDKLSTAQQYKESQQVVTRVCMHLAFNPTVDTILAQPTNPPEVAPPKPKTLWERLEALGNKFKH